MVFLAAATVYATAYNFFSKAKNNTGRVETLMVAETIARKIALANRVVIDSGGQQIRIRWDYAAGTFAPRNTPSDFTDDSWIKYAIIGGKIYWRNEAVGGNPDDPAPAVGTTGAGNSEWSPDLTITSNPTFTLINPSLALDPGNSGDATVVDINLTTSSGTPAQTMTVKTNAALGMGSKN